MISVEILLVILLMMMNSITGHHVISFISKVNLLFLVTFLMFKGCLHCKMITSQNVGSEIQIKSFSLLQQNYVPFSRYSSFSIFNHPMIYQICDVMIRICTWDKVHFWTTTHEVTKLGQLIDISNGNNFE